MISLKIATSKRGKVSEVLDPTDISQFFQY